MFRSSLFSYSYIKIFNLEKRNLKETLQSIKTFVALTRIKTRVCQLGKGRAKVVSLLFQPTRFIISWRRRSTRVIENCHPYTETSSEPWSVHLLAVGVRLRSKYLACEATKLLLSSLEGEKRYLNQALFRPIRQQLRAREQSIKP